MSSKLFHTVVAFGITLGAASVGCSAEPVDAPASSESAVVSKDNSEATDTKVDTDKAQPAAEKDRFCEVAWPTTKGGPRPAKAQACIDPQNQCGVYPGGIFSQDTCYEVAADGTTCNAKEVWMFCKDTGTSHEWTCPSGTIKVNQCVWPAPDGSDNTTKERPERPVGGYGYGG
jgi:hypothetical protein